MFVVDGGCTHALLPMREPVIGEEPQSTNPVIDGVVVVVVARTSLVDETGVGSVVVIARISLVDESGIGGSPVDEFFRLEPKGDFLLGRFDRI